MNETTHKAIKAAVIAAAISATIVVPVGLAVAGPPQDTGTPSAIVQALNAGKAAITGIFAGAKKPATAAQATARPDGVNLDMIYMPGQGNGVCSADQGKRDSCMVDVVVTYGDGVKRTDFGVFIGHNLIATNYELVSGHDDGHAVKPDDGHVFTVALSDGTTRKALPWALVPGTVAVLRMQ